MKMLFWLLCGFINFLLLARMMGIDKIDNEDKSMLPICLILGSLGLIVVLSLCFISGVFIFGPIEQWLNSVLQLINGDDKNV